MGKLPAPPVPITCDLRGMPFMPFDIVRLFDSDTYLLSTGAEFKAAFTLWGKSFLQVPAGSLPKDEKILAQLSGAGDNWPNVRAMAMRGWYEAKGGRLYHPVVIEKVREAWESRQEMRAKIENERMRKVREREDRAEMFAVLRAAGQVPAWNTTTAELRRLVTDLSRGQVTDSHANSHAPVPGESRLRQGQGQGQGQGGGERTAPPTPRPLDLLGKALRRRGLSSAPQAVTEWSDFLQGACKIKSADEAPRALELIFEAAKREGMVVGYAKHAAVFAERVAMELKTERQARGAA